MDRRALVLASLVLLAVLAAESALAKEIVPFDVKAFAAAQEANQSIVVAINAPW